MSRYVSLPLTSKTKLKYFNNEGDTPSEAEIDPGMWGLQPYV